MHAGCRALHEANGRDGSVSCWLAVDDWWHPNMAANGLRKDFPGSEILHVLRHPLAAIPSMKEFKHPLFWHWQQQHSGVLYEPDSLDFYARFWLRWNELIDEQKPFARLRIENPGETWPLIANTLEIKPEMPAAEIDPTWVSKKKTEITWDDLGDSADALRKAAREYGYKEV